MTKTIHGKVRGKTIELDEDLGVVEGQQVEVHVKVIPKVARTLARDSCALRGLSTTTPNRIRSWRKSTVNAKEACHDQAVYNLTLVTHNTTDFQNIPGLRLDDWLTPHKFAMTEKTLIERSRATRHTKTVI